MMNEFEIKHLVKNLLKSEGVERKAQLDRLKTVPKQELYNHLKQMIENGESEDDDTDFNAADISILLLDDLGIKLLINSMEKVSTHLRWHIVGLLGDLTNTIAIPILIKTLYNDSESHIRIQGALSLGRLGGKESFEALKNVINKDIGQDHEGRTVSESAEYAIKTYFFPLNKD